MDDEIAHQLRTVSEQVDELGKTIATIAEPQKRYILHVSDATDEMGRQLTRIEGKLDILSMCG